jgi:lipopolysaccharide export system permease protein
LRLSALGSAVGGQLRSGLWIKDSVRGADGALVRQRFVNIGELMPDTTLRRVKIMEFDPDMRLAEIVEAERGEFRGPDSWQLSGVVRTRYQHGEITPRAAAPSAPPNQAGSPPPLPLLLTQGSTPLLSAARDAPGELIWRSELNPGLLGVLMISPERMSAIGLFNYIRHLRENQQTTERYEIAFWKKMVYPLAVLVMMALALPFGYLQARAGGVGYKLFAGIMLGVSFHFLNGLFSHLGMLNTWPPLLAVAAPSLTAFVIAIGMLAWVDRTR